MSSVSEAKRQYGLRLVQYIEEYSKALIVHCDNVGSRQMQNIRIALRGKAAMIMGKNVSNPSSLAQTIAKPDPLLFLYRPPSVRLSRTT